MFSFIFDIAFFIFLPWLIWRALGRTVPITIIPISVGLLLAAAGWNEHHYVQPSAIAGQIGFIGVLLLAFTAGIESHCGEPVSSSNRLRNMLRIMGSAVHALLLPFIVGTAAALLYFNRLPGWSMTGDDTDWFSALSIGLCLAVSALPVLIGIIRELPARYRPLGAVALNLAVIDDIILWSGLALLLIAANASTKAFGVEAEHAFAVAALGGLVLLNRLLSSYQAHTVIAWLIAVLFLALGAWSSNTLGLHALLGAYFAGVMLPRNIIKHLPVEKLGMLTLFVLAPLFFGHSGLRISSDALTWGALFAASGLLLLSATSKIGAVWLFPPLASLNKRETLAVGALLQCKGLMEIVAATILHQQGILSEYVYAALVTLAVLSTALTRPLFNLFIKGR